MKNDVCYSDVPAVVVGISAGVSYGALGSTHHSLHDIAALRAIHNIAIVAPADNAETRDAVRAAAASARPVYLRFGKAAMYDLPAGDGPPFTLGRSRRLREGRDAALISTGETVIHAVLAAALLAGEGIACRVLSMPTIRPLDEEAVRAAGRECGLVLTVEEHSIHGGLGEACAAVLMLALGRCSSRAATWLMSAGLIRGSSPCTLTTRSSDPSCSSALASAKRSLPLG